MPKLTKRQREARERNEIRAERGDTALNAYRQTTGTDPNASVRDLLSDLMHCCSLSSIDFDDELGSAYMNYRAEKAEES